MRKINTQKLTYVLLWLFATAATSVYFFNTLSPGYPFVRAVAASLISAYIISVATIVGGASFFAFKAFIEWLHK